MNSMGIKPWEILNRRELFHDPPWVRLSVEQVRTSGGRILDNFYSVQLPEYAAVLAYTEDGNIVVERQCKHAVGEISLGFPAGYLELNEDPLEGASRELLEETGYAASVWRSLGSFVVDGNRGCGRAHLFLARGARPVAAPEQDDGEQIELILMKPHAVAEAFQKGQIRTLANAALAAWVAAPATMQAFSEQGGTRRD